MIYKGRRVDPVALWEEFTEIPANKADDTPFIHGLLCPNPEHNNSRKPGPFQINVTQPTVHCFARCGIEGTYENAIMLITGCNRKEAQRRILRHSRVATGKATGRKVRDGRGRIVSSAKRDEEAVSLDYDPFLPPVALEYLASRGFVDSSVARFSLGWDQDSKRIVIPADDLEGVRRFLIRRAIKDRQWPKYLYTEGFPKTSLLYGACRLDRDRVRSDGLVLVEGSVDAIKNHQHGLTNTAATLGTGLSVEQRDIIARLRPKRVVLMFDKDAAGIRSIVIARDMLKNYPLYVIRYPRGKSDPGELSREEAQRQYDRAVPLAQFMRLVPQSMKRRRENRGSENEGKQEGRKAHHTSRYVRR